MTTMLKKVAFWAIVLTVGCNSYDRESTPTSGKLYMLCDEAVSPVIEIARTEFERKYVDSRITMRLVTSTEAIVRLINGDVEFIVSSRELDSTETDFLIRNEVKVFSQKFALDGVAILVNKANPISELNLDQLAKVLSGGFDQWPVVADSLDFPRSVRAIEVVCDGRRSGNYAVLRHLVFDMEQLSPDAVIINGDSLTSSTPAIMEYVATHPGAIGYVSTAWVDKGNPSYVKYGPDLKILRLSGQDFHKAVDPIPGYIYRGDYPLRRVLYVIHRQKYIGLAAGFTSFLTGNEGQKICLENNLVPGMNPIRLKHE